MRETEQPDFVKFLATLVRGEVHYLREIRFDHGIPTVIEDFHKIHLEEHAVDVVPVPGWSAEYDADAPRTETRAKFTFTLYAGPLDVGSVVLSSAAGVIDRDANASAARMRRFNEKERLRLASIAPQPTPAFDPQADPVEAPPAVDAAEITLAPRPRRRA